MPLILRRNWISASVLERCGLHRGQWFLGNFHSFLRLIGLKDVKESIRHTRNFIEVQPGNPRPTRDLKNSFGKCFHFNLFSRASMGTGIFIYIYPIKSKKNQLNVGKYTSPMDAMCVFFFQSQCLFGEKKRSGNVAAASRAMLRRGRCISPSCRGTAGLGTSNDTKLPVPVIKIRGLLNMPKWP